MNNIDLEVTFEIDCYACGNILSIPFRLGVQQSEYMYCQECQEGIQIYSPNGTRIHISRLEQE